MTGFVFAKSSTSFTIRPRSSVSSPLNGSSSRRISASNASARANATLRHIPPLSSAGFLLNASESSTFRASLLRVPLSTRRQHCRARSATGAGGHFEKQRLFFAFEPGNIAGIRLFEPENYAHQRCLSASRCAAYRKIPLSGIPVLILSSTETPSNDFEMF